jgi:superfamily II DNA or RNA helicase
LELYPYQTAVIAEIESLISSVARICLQAATGSGKTVIASELIKRAVAAGERVLFIAHRLELIEQASQKLLAFDITHGIIKAGYPMRLGERVQVASIQTLFARAVRGRKIDLPEVDWVFFDEAHHVRARTYMAVVEAYPNARIIGLTATPCRADGRGLAMCSRRWSSAPTRLS